jgi:MOSC domain-containing protein YiiM
VPAGSATVPGVSEVADKGEVVEINISPTHEQLPAPVESVRAVPGRGLEGDRYFVADGNPEPDGEDITLVATEALEALEREHEITLSPAETRRNVATRGIDLNTLVGRRFRIGELECEGRELCEPCNHLQGLTQPGVLKGLVHRGGLRAAILLEGRIAVGDPIAEIPPR